MGNCLSCFKKIKKNFPKTEQKKPKISFKPIEQIKTTNEEVYNQYHVFSKIGSGKMSKTYLAVDETGQRIALKSFQKEKIPIRYNEA